MSLRVRRAVFSCLLILPLFYYAPPAVAEVRVEVELGFHGVFNLGHPFPVSVILTNLGGPVEGILEVGVWKGGPTKVAAPYPFFHRKEIFLAAQSKRRVQFTVNPDSMSRPLKVTFSSPAVKDSMDFDLRGHFSPSPLILLVTGSSALLSIPLANDPTVPVVSISADELPSDTRAYQGIWAVLFYEQSLRDLSGNQMVALERWLLAGGKILVLGGLHYALYQEPSLGVFLPVRVVGLKKLTALPNLEKYYGQDLPPLGTFWVQDSKVMKGNILIEEGKTPILVEMTRGKGKVFYLSLDVGRPPFSQWKGLSLVFSDLLGEPGVRRPGPWAGWNDDIFSRFLSDSTLFDTRIPLLPFLFCLFFYGGSLFLMARLWIQQRGSHSTLFVSFVLFVIFVTVGGYLYFDRGNYRPDGLLISSSLLEAYPDGYAEVQSNVGLFSTRRRNFSFQMERGWSDLEMVQPHKAREDIPSVVIEDGIRSTVLSFPSREWNYRLFRVRSVKAFSLGIEVARRENQLSLKLSNLSRKDLTECWLVLFGKATFLGDIPKGSVLVRDLSFSADGKRVEGPGKSIPLREIPFKEKGREILFRYSLFPPDQELVNWGEKDSFLIGWLEGDSRRVWVDDERVLAYNFSLFRAALSLDVEDEL